VDKTTDTLQSTSRQRQTKKGNLTNLIRSKNPPKSLAIRSTDTSVKTAQSFEVIAEHGEFIFCPPQTPQVYLDRNVVFIPIGILPRESLMHVTARTSTVTRRRSQLYYRDLSCY